MFWVLWKNQSAWIALFVIVGAIGIGRSASGETLRAGIIGCDTSHVPAFVKLLNAKRDADDPLAGVRVVAAFPGGSDDIASSRDRVEGFTQQLRDMDIEIVSSIDELLTRVDVVLLESTDARKHLEQIRPVIEAGKPVFVDKPFAPSVADAIAIFRLAEKHEVPIFTSSMLRFVPEIVATKNDSEIGKVTGCDAYSPCSLEATHPDLFWYGIHGVEILFTIMGPGCEQVTRTQTKDTDVVTGVWGDGRVGSFRGLRSGKSDFGALVFGEKAIRHCQRTGSYEPLVAEIVRFFKSGVPPVSAEETIQIIAFMEAAELCKEQPGGIVKIRDVMDAAEAKQTK